MSSATHGATPYYFVPAPSRHPVMAAIGLFFVILGAGQWINGAGWGAWSLAFGMVWWLVTLYQWFGDSIAESEGGLYGYKIDLSFRWSMSWFIFSEVMFFGAFFTALWWARAQAHERPGHRLDGAPKRLFGRAGSHAHAPACLPGTAAAVSALLVSGAAGVLPPTSKKV